MLKSEGVMVMIEVIYKEEKRESKEDLKTLQIPRNIRQIGMIHGNYRIYIEDYVDTFLRRIAEKTEQDKGGLAILFGNAEWADGVNYVFAKGAVLVEEESITKEHVSISNDAWKQIQETGEKYFEELAVVGWFLTAPGISMKISEIVAKTHLKYFSGSEKVLMLMESAEKEEAFFSYENGRFARVPGYYLYYEKNPMMQEYMIEKKWWDVTENIEVAPDEAVRNFRTIIGKKAEKTEDSGEKTSVFSYAATACLVLAVLVTGANFIKNYQKIQYAEESLEASTVFTVNDEIVSITPVEETVNKVLDENLQEEEKRTEERTEKIIVEDDAAEQIDTEINAMINEETNKETNKETEGELTSIEKTMKEMTGDEKSQETDSTQVRDTYVIRPGDTLYQISIAKYGSLEAITEICELNDLSLEEIIYPGQIIVLP